MALQGYIKLYRQIQENWLWQERRTFSKAEAWIDILLMVNHSDKKVPLGNELIPVKKGSRIISIRQLCEKWNWSNTKVKSFLELLQKDEMIVYKSDTKKTVLSVVNWELYQCSNDTETSQKHRKNVTETSRKHTNKNDKNDKNDKNEEEDIIELEQQKLQPPFITFKQQILFNQFWGKYPKKKNKGQAEKTWVKVNPNEQLVATILTAIELAKKSKEWQKNNGEFIPHPSTWLNAKGWEDDYKPSVTGGRKEEPTNDWGWQRES